MKMTPRSARTAFRINPKTTRFVRRAAVALGILAILSPLLSTPQGMVSGAAILTIEPITWNMVGLDSNNVNIGPADFPVGARVCNAGDEDATNVSSHFVWGTVDNPDLSTDPYINLRDTSLTEYTTANGHAYASLAPGACTDFYYEVEVERRSDAYEKRRQFTVTASADGLGTISLPEAREIYIEHLISQNRNSTTRIRLDGAIIPPGSGMSLIVGRQYAITLEAATATQGYNQIETFIHFPNTIFRVISVSTDYSAETSPFVTDPDDKLYGDACGWDSDFNSPGYASCIGGDGKAGGTVIVTYQVEVIGGGGASETLNTLIYDFSGSSFHYNSDYSTSSVIANITDPADVTIAKEFVPASTTVGGTSTLVFTIDNPNGEPMTGVNFTDPLPDSPDQMRVAAAPNFSYSTSGCGMPTFAPSPGDTSLSFDNGTIAANSTCTIRVNVSATAQGTYVNTTNHLFIGGTDTGKGSNEATLTVGATPTQPSCTPGLELARWTMETSAGSGAPPVYSFKSSRVPTAAASFYTSIAPPAGQSIYTGAIIGTQPLNYWAGIGWLTSSGKPTPTTETYFSIVVSTAGFSDVAISYRAAGATSGWANPSNNEMWLFSSTDNFSSYDQIAYYNNFSRGTWNTYTGIAMETGDTTTYFRFIPRGRSVGSPDAVAYIDDIVVTGCGVPQQPTLTKQFAPTVIPIGGTSVLTFTLTNENNIALTSAGFTDALPDGVQVAGSPGVVNGCGGTFSADPSATTVSLTNGTLPARTGFTAVTCTIAVNVTATTAGPHTNVSGYISTAETGTNNTSSGSGTDTLTALAPPVISKFFAPNPILINGLSTLTFRLVNPNPSHPLSGVSFSDTFPVGVVRASVPDANQCGGAVSSTAGSIQLTGGNLAAGASCTVSVAVTSSVVVLVDTGYLNTAGNPSSLEGGTADQTETSRQDTLIVQPNHPQISILKQVSTSPTGPWTSFVAVPAGTRLYYRFSVENTGDVNLTDARVEDAMLAGLGVSLSACAWDDLLSYQNTTDTVVTCVAGTDDLHPVLAAAGEHINTATAYATYAAADDVQAAGDALYATTGLTIAKSAAETRFTAAGTALHYSFVVTNSGSAPLANPVTVADDKAADEACPSTETVGDEDLFLDAGESLTCTATYTTTAGDVTAGFVTNTATAAADGVTSDPDSETVFYASLSIDKTAAETHFAGSGETIHYSFLVTNDGDLRLAGPVTVSDDLATDEACPNVNTVGNNDAYLDIGESIVCTATYLTTGGDVSTGSVTNQASATADGVTSPTDTLTLPYNLFTDTPTVSPTNTTTPTITHTPTETETPTQTALASDTPTETETATETPTRTSTATITHTPSETFTPTETATDTPTVTETATDTPTRTATFTETLTPSETPTPTETATGTASHTRTATDTGTPTDTPTETETSTDTPSRTSTHTETHTPSASTTATSTATHTSTFTATRSATRTETPTSTGTITPTHTATHTVTATRTPTATLTPVAAGAKEIVGHSLPDTALPNVAIGEMVQYRVRLTLGPDSSIASLMLTDILDRGLAFVRCDSITSAGGSLSLTPLQLQSVCGSAAVSRYPAASANPADLGRQVAFTFGAVSNTDPGADSEILVEYTAVVIDNAENLRGETPGNRARWSWTGGELIRSATPLAVVEPQLAVSKQADATVVLPGQIVTFTLALQHTGISNEDAYDVVVQDILPAALEYIPGSLQVLSGQAPAPGGVDDSAAPTLQVRWTRFRLGLGVTLVQFQARVAAAPGLSGASITNTATAAWSSLPGDVSAPQTGNNPLSTERFYDPGSSVNAYFASGSLTLNPPQIPNTGFAPGRRTSPPPQPLDLAYLTYGDLRLEIPKLNQDLSIVGIPLGKTGWDLSWLGNEAGYLEGTAFPTWRGNSVLTAHVYNAFGNPGPFIRLHTLSWGDSVRVHAFGVVFTYEVREVKRILPSSLYPFQHEDESWLTLLTCQGYNEKSGTYKYRVAVRAVLIRVESTP